MHIRPTSVSGIALLFLTRARSRFRRQKCGNVGSPCLDKPVLLRGTYHGTHIARISESDPSSHDNAKQWASIHPRAQEDMELQSHQHFATHIDPSSSLHRAINGILLDWNRKNDTSKKDGKVRKHGVAVFGQAHVRTRG